MSSEEIHLETWDVIGSLSPHCRVEIERALQTSFDTVSLTCRRAIQVAAGVVAEPELPRSTPQSNGPDIGNAVNNARDDWELLSPLGFLASTR